MVSIHFFMDETDDIFAKESHANRRHQMKNFSSFISPSDPPPLKLVEPKIFVMMPRVVRILWA